MINGKRPHSPSPYRNGTNGSSNGSNGSGGYGHQAEDKSLAQTRRNLPIFPAKKRFLEEATKHNTVILLAETGTGKTTQVPQFIHEARLDREGCIAITQPRRVAAISLSKRVAQETQTEPGGLVGYRVRFEDVTSNSTKILFLTDGMLLREAMVDPSLSRYTWIILDEAHERTVNTDILFGVVKTAQKERRPGQNSDLSPLRVVVMSATVDADRFAQYWHCPVLYIEGRQFPVNIRHISQPTDDWQRSMMSTIFQIHSTAPEREDILAFMTGQEEIETAARQARMLAREYPNAPRLVVCTLYAAQSCDIQQNALRPTQAGGRKLVLATNIAETSLTIPGIKHVVDSCRVKAKAHQAKVGLDMLKVVKVSQAQALQRTGRAGRERDGDCYRLLTKVEYDQLPRATVPEILRSNLASTILTMMNIGIKDVPSFDFMDPPKPDSLNSALRQLSLLGAVELSGGGTRLTQLGEKMAGFPLDPRFTNCLLSAEQLGCTEEMLSIVSLLTAENVFQVPGPRDKREEADMVHKKFATSEGDLITLLNVWRAYRNGPKTPGWCRSQFLIPRHLTFAQDVRKQLVGICHNAGVAIQSCRDMEVVRQAVARGLFMNVAQLSAEGHYVALDSGQHVHIHPSSVLFRKKPEIVTYTEMVATNKTYIRGLTIVSEEWLSEHQADYFRSHRITR
ncbi:putative ATP-dependent RNA helicase DHX33 isoform X2 [Eurytemora carolleeae]|uniref:putative ATP-dependent RNA helicase DHX33 isoform X2 n=1 Tax=Eurytemora carolleeae TaxID=1294199 RepID=UPI000C78E75F|nr:putative ATP-dependent RNA helicase DHX33 isoform X2 [Eurytemora carolleeae]|eukprot:XP_023319650.1 putative ATP-dependent RNA helicase DHX33 isoform X2 [Eurytemora affinis]